MNKTALALASVIVVCALPGLAGARPAPRRTAAAAPGPHWDQTIAMTADGFPVMGNPDAPVKVIEFISFTCSHCAEFSKESKVPLTGGLVRQGKVSVELRPYLRNSIDNIPALLALCGDKSRYFPNEAALLGLQESWFRKPADPGYEARWQALEQDPPAQRKAVAQELGLYKIMLARGYTPAALDACLADEAKLSWLTTQTDYASNTIGVTGTPSFVINGALQIVYDWANLKPRLDAVLAGGPAVPQLPDNPTIDLRGFR